MKANFREKPRDYRVEALQIPALRPDAVVLMTVMGPMAFPPGAWIVKSRHTNMLMPPISDEEFQKHFEPIPQEEQDQEVLPENDPGEGKINFEAPEMKQIVPPNPPQLKLV